MEILYLIGNGFDINAGLKTQANEVVGSYVKSLNNRIGSGEKPPIGVQRLLESMEDDVESWSDFEMRFGRFSSDLESESEPSKCFMEAFGDLDGSLPKP